MLYYKHGGAFSFCCSLCILKPYAVSAEKEIDQDEKSGIDLARVAFNAFVAQRDGLGGLRAQLGAVALNGDLSRTARKPNELFSLI